MNQFLIRFTFFLIAFSQTLPGLSAQIIYKYGLDKGLSQSTVYAMLQDHLGFLWVGTADGLNRFDGNTFKTYRFSDQQLKNGASNFISGLLIEDTAHNIWFGTNHIIGKYNFQTNKLEKIPIKLKNIYGNIFILKVNQDEIWFNWTYYIVNFKFKTGSITYYNIPDVDPKYDYYRSFVTDNKGKMWVNTNHGITCFDTDRKQFKLYPFPSEYTASNGYLNLLAIGNDESKIINSSKGLLRVKCNPLKIEIIVSEFIHKTITGLLISDDKLILGIPGIGLDFYDLKTFTLSKRITEGASSYQLSNRIFTMLYKDNSNNLWIGMDGFGLNSLNLEPEKFKLYNRDQFPNWPACGNFIKNFLKSGDTLFFGTHEYGLWGLSLNENKFFPLPMPAKFGKVITGIFAYSKNEILIGGISSAIIYNLYSHHTKEITFKLIEKGRNINILSIYPFKDGSIMAATLIGNYYYNGGSKFIFKNIEAHNSYSVAIFHDQKKRIWVSSIMGGAISRYHKKGGELFYTDYLLHQNNVRGFYEDTSKHHLWMASEQGLIDYNLKTEKYILISKKDGLTENYLYSVLPGKGDELWLSGNKGLICFHSASGKVENYDPSDGLQSNEFNTGSAYQSHDGYLYFGGVNGFNRFNPKRITINKHKPVIALTGLKIMDIHLPDTVNSISLKKIVLPYDQNTLSIEFTALEMSRPDKVKSKYKLVGADPYWVDEPEKRMVRYPNLQPGSYKFLAMACNSDEIWSKEYLLLEVTIEKPWWLNWHILFIEFIGILLLITGAVKWFIKSKLNEKQRELNRLNSIHAERERISRDMHDDLGSGLTRISILSQLLKQNMNEDLRKQQVDKIADTAGELVDNMSNLVWTMNPGNDTLQNLLAYLRQYIFHFFENTTLTPAINFDETDNDISITPEIRKNVFLIIKETCNNSLKYAQATNISITFNSCANQCVFTIKDNGKGFDINNTRRFGNGLTNMRKRMQDIGGTFEIISQPEAGTQTSIAFEIRN
ncbi:MAG: hypothetical protein H7296_05065 [Bacteroidia bacterium]|nr:hypothetical protein [Bacteroidia bacterium]